jgi:hypothetical protein
VWLVEHRDSGAQGSGRPRRTPDKHDRHLRFLAFRDHPPHVHKLYSYSLIQYNGWTNLYGNIANNLSSNKILGLYSYRPHLVLPLTCELFR